MEQVILLYCHNGTQKRALLSQFRFYSISEK